jgi:uncharacterized protein YbbK (DUF523 family)
MSEKNRLGLSSCLLGERVLCDGGHQLDHFLREQVYLAPHPVELKLRNHA